MRAREFAVEEIVISVTMPLLGGSLLGFGRSGGGGAVSLLPRSRNRTSVLIIKLGLNLLPADLFVAFRFSLASFLVLLFLRRNGWVDWTLLRTRPIWVVGFVNALGYVLQFQGQRFTTSSDAALIISTAALMIPILSCARGSEMIGAKKG